MSKRRKILWLVSWYPNKYDRFDGDFIQRHARAAALYDDVHVIFVKTFDKQQSVEEDLNECKGLTEQIIYVPESTGAINKLKNYMTWKRTYKVAVSSLVEKYKPHIVHVHIPWKVGLIALWIKKKYAIPFVVTEHWGIYNTVVADNIHTKHFLVRHLLRRIYKKAKTFVSVSKFLGDAVNKTLVRKEFTVIPNVVDTSLFFYDNKKYSAFTFLHVSNMVPLKKVEGILNAFSLFLQKTNANAQLILVGNKDDYYQSIAERLELLNHSVFFKGELPYPEVAKIMQRSHVFILNSSIENSPCVISEALCTGLPVIATNVGGIPELVTPENGLLISVHDERVLSKAIHRVFDEYQLFDLKAVSILAEKKFSMKAVGSEISGLY